MKNEKNESIRIIPVVEEVWLTNNGEFVYVEYNACRCCPDSVTMQWGKGFYQAGSYGTYPRGKFTKELLSRGWERLDRNRWVFARTFSK